MRNYSIHFRTVTDFRNYANMICRFPVAGYVHTEDFRENMYDLLDIVCHCPQDDLTLSLTKYQESDISGFEAYLSDTGLLNLTRPLAT